MRLKNIKGAGVAVRESKYIIDCPNLYKGKYKELFGNNNPIYIEIGMGKGNFIINNALKYPNINFIGIEKYNSVMYRAIQKLENTILPNLKLIRMDANEIDSVFANEIDLIYLNFSDPWPKKRHTNRRLTSPVFLKKYDSIFKANKIILMKTDNADLFSYSIITLNNYGYQFEDILVDLHHSEIKDNIMTEYEEKFLMKGKNIFYIKATK